MLAYVAASPYRLPCRRCGAETVSAAQVPTPATVAALMLRALEDPAVLTDFRAVLLTGSVSIS